MSNKPNQKKMLGIAIAIVAEAFKNVTDRGGEPYIFHLLYVMNKMPEGDYELRQIAVLHDLIEDFPKEWGIAKLKRLGFSMRVLTALAFLTHDDSDTYEKYIQDMIDGDCPDAAKVKLADLDHNSQISRLKGLQQKDFDRLEKYARAYTKLKQWLRSINEIS